ncbi:LIP-domain-containing protein [Microthyrium microscopicum]|uniref:LIP-domain-containing protein n=1 Tax=Microthyrium microscopicum TaxID=703497 RepID=A0A6A6USJ3_9PEZI|nr:LIP-domain-containing protein [Microthyrium microscopicum]
MYTPLRLWLLLATIESVALCAPSPQQEPSPLDLPPSKPYQSVLPSLKSHPPKVSNGTSSGHSAPAAPPKSSSVSSAKTSPTGSSAAIPYRNTTSTGIISSATASPKASMAPPFKVPDNFPGNDEWYRPPAGFGKEKTGALLKYRKTPKAISLDNKSALKMKEAWQLMYRTQNTVGEPESSVVTVLVPYNATRSNVFAYHWFSDSTYQDCSPSLGMQVGTRTDNTYTQKQTGILVSALAQGWHVVVPDDGGPHAIFGNSKYLGYSILDSLKVVVNSTEIVGLDPDPIVTTYGYSGGAMSGTFAMEMQPTYAPDLKIAGAALGGLLPNMTFVMTHMHYVANRSAYGPPLIAGFAKEYANLTNWLDENLAPEHAEEFRKVYTQCYDANWDLFSKRPTTEYLKRGIDSLEDAIPVSVFNNSGNLGQNGSPKVPLYIYETVGDDASPVNFTDAIITKYCKEGANIEYERNPIRITHSEEMVAGLPGAMRWLQDRHEGKDIVTGCRNSTETTFSKDAKKQGHLVTGILGTLFAYFGFTIGPDYWIAPFTMFWP